MLKINLGAENGPSVVMASGELGDICAEIGMVIANLYKKMKQDAPLRPRRSAAAWCA